MAFVEKFGRRTGVLTYQGTWNAATNTPVANGSGVGKPVVLCYF
jgi:hypothetical protein